MMRSFLHYLGPIMTMACSGAPEVSSPTNEGDQPEDAAEIGTEIQVDLTINFNPPPNEAADAKLFVLGWESIDERSERPPQNTRPDFLPLDLTDRLSGPVLEIPGFTVKAGLYYFAQYGAGLEPGPQFRSSAPTQPSSGSLVLEVTGEVIPSDNSSTRGP